MKKLNRTPWLCLVLALALCVIGGNDALAKKKWEKIDIPELNEIAMPPYERVELDNGMVVYLAEDHEFPLVELSATIEVGAIYEPADKVGLASMTGTVMRSGGTETHPGDALDEMVESRGMRVETWIGQADGGAYLSVMKEDTGLGMQLLADILMHPAFPEDKIKLAKESQKAAISRRNDDPMTIARREGMKAVFGEDHELARHTEYGTIAAVTRQDMIDFHEAYFGPDRMYLVVIGDFDSREMVQLIEESFAGWAPAAEPLPADPEIPDLPRTVNVVDKDDLTQTTVIMGHKGIRADNPHYAGLQVANRILGGGFATRLFNEVRSRQGLAYSVGSSPGTGFRYPGMFMAFTMTKSETTEKAAEAILVEIQRMLDEEVTVEELERAKDGILNSEVFNFDTKREILDRMVMFERYGYPSEFMQQYQDDVRDMTRAGVREACAAVWKPDQMTILGVGNYADWDGDFSKFGPVTMVDIEIPEPAMDIPEPTDETLARGSELMRRAGEVAGADKMASLQGYFMRQVLSATIQGMAMEFTVEETVHYPDRQYALQKTQFGDGVQVLDGDQGWSKAIAKNGAVMQESEMTADEVADAKNDLKSDYIGTFRNLEDYRFQALEPRSIEGVDCLPVYATGVGDDYTIFFLRADDLRVRALQSPGESPATGAPVTTKIIHDEYRDFDGILLAAKSRMLFDDELFAEIELVDFTANPALDESLFVK